MAGVSGVFIIGVLELYEKLGFVVVAHDDVFDDGLVFVGVHEMLLECQHRI